MLPKNIEHIFVALGKMLEYVNGPSHYNTSGYSTPKIMHMDGDLLYLNDVNYPMIHPSWWLYRRRSDRTIPSSH